MSESLRTRLERYRFNLFPAYRLAGGRIRYISADWREVRVAVDHCWRTKNIFGTTFGGSIYAAIDPIYATMLVRLLGDGYVVWDKAASIEYERPATETLYARFRFSEAELESIGTALDTTDSITREYDVHVVDADGTLHATAEKTIYVGTDESKAA